MIEGSSKSLKTPTRDTSREGKMVGSGRRMILRVIVTLG